MLYLPRTDDDRNRFGSLSAVTGRWAGSDNYLPDWLEEGTESSLRDTEADIPQPPVLAAQSSVARSISSTSARPSPAVLTPTGGPSPAGSFSKQEVTKAAYIDLDKFYEDAEDTEETDESESGENDEDDEDEDDGEGSGEEAESSGEEDSSEETLSEEEHVQSTTT